MFRTKYHDTLPSNEKPPFMATMPTATRHQLPHISQQGVEHRLPYSPEPLDPSEKDKPSLDFTQRIERKLAKYNASDNVFKRWLFEMSSWLISACSMIAIVVIYVRIKDQPMSSHSASLTWTNVLGKIASAALIVPTSEALGQLKWNWFHDSKAMWDFEIFDKASRGPLGALMLLYRTKGRSLAALGALLILLLLAIDTFFQQVTTLSDQWTLQASLAVAPKAYTYESAYPKEYLEGYEIATDDKDTFLVIEKFSYGEGIRPVVFGNAVRPDISIVSATSCGSASSRSHADHLRIVLLDQQLHMATVQDTGCLQPMYGHICGTLLCLSDANRGLDRRFGWFV
jgi:hypothetical protein